MTIRFQPWNETKLLTNEVKLPSSAGSYACEVTFHPFKRLTVLTLPLSIERVADFTYSKLWYGMDLTVRLSCTQRKGRNAIHKPANIPMQYEVALALWNSRRKNSCPF